MDTRDLTSGSQHYYPPSSWSSATASAAASKNPINTTSQTSSDCPSEATTPSIAHYPHQLDFIPLLFPQQSNLYHAQLLHYNKLVSPSRGGGLQTSPLPPVVSAPHIQTKTRSRSSSRVSLKDGTSGKASAAGGHGNRSLHYPEKSRSVLPTKAAPSKMSSRQAAEPSRNPPNRSTPASSSIQGQSHSSSVPSTPHQHARQFSFESREPSPTANNHSPRSAYSETNSTLPSLRPLPPRLGGCKFETAQMNSRRRIPYSVGSERLERLDLRAVKSKLSEVEEKKLANDMSQIFDRLLPSESVEENRKRLVRKLERIFNEEWPGHDIRVHLFGSSGNLLCSDDSDVDICITTSWQELEGVCIIADLLARRGMEKVVCISAAKVPIVKIWDPELGLACDMNVNNTLALENTRMVRTYVEADPRVRQLAMIVKYWTRRRIVNDAAFGGTLSSYTWICLIIAFLQLRNPPVVPALHQLPHKLSKPDGSVSDFADDLQKIRGFGSKNESSVADLLFQFFRFYAHEFDYDNCVLSVRLGRLVPKAEKKWNYHVNNQLCIEEPFNVSRNLGNTADEYSFRGLHLELRRAYDLISDGKLDEACEQYVFPKEEERVWTRPPPQPRPVLLRSSSQSHSTRGGRGNHRGGRHPSLHRGGGAGPGTGPNRRASSSIPAYDHGMFMAPISLHQDLSWYQNSQYQFQYAQQDLMTQMAYHQENLRQLHMYAQSPALLQHQVLNQPRIASASGSGQGQQTDRSRTNSFDNVGVGAPLRPDLYALYGMNLGHAFYSHAPSGCGTYPSSPVTVSGSGQEFRRPLQRSVITTDSGASASSSSLRSQSQPATRSLFSAHPQASHRPRNEIPSSSSVFGTRNVNGIPLPSFMSDEADFDDNPSSSSGSPDLEEGKRSGLLVAGSSSPTHRGEHRKHPPNGLSFGDLAACSATPGRRRLSTDNVPQTVLDRRMRRTSRSPSPLRHARAFSVGTTSALCANRSHGKNPSRPLVVNGSGLRASSNASQVQAPRTGLLESKDRPASGLDKMLPPESASCTEGSSIGLPAPPHASAASSSQPTPDRSPVVVNGSSMPRFVSSVDESSSNDRAAVLSSLHPPSNTGRQESAEGSVGQTSPSRRWHMAARQADNGTIAPLDLAIGEHFPNQASGVDLVHLSPVYETRTPSPIVTRKKETAWFPVTTAWSGKDKGLSSPDEDEKTSRLKKGQVSQRVAKEATLASEGTSSRANGHVRSAKSESDGGWQRAGGKGKKRTTAGFGQGEELPKNEGERKGG